MTLASRGARRIVVDGAVYRWVVRRKPTYHQGNAWSPIRFAVERADQPGAVLVVLSSRAHPGNWMRRPISMARPAVVAASIWLALGQGWSPTAAGPAFTLEPGDEIWSADDGPDPGPGHR